MKIAILTTDARECYGDYHRPVPYFGIGTARLLSALDECTDLEVHIVSCSRRPVSAPERYGERLRFHSVVVPRIGWMRTAYLGCVLATRRRLRMIEPDLVHGHGTERDCALSAAFSGYPNLVTVRGNMRSIARLYRARPLSYLWTAARLESVALSRTRGVICLTRYAERQVESLVRRCWRIPNAVEPGLFDLSADAVEPPVILCVGTICPHKNQVRLLRALDRMASRVEFRAVFVGDAPPGIYTEEFHRLAAERSWCRVTGSLSRPDVVREMETAGVMVLPTLEDNCPNVVLESMAAGIPVAAARVGGVPDLVEAGKTGVLFNPRDESDMAESLEHLLTDRTAAHRMAAAAREIARDRFHPQVIAREHEQVYRDLLLAAS